MGKITVFKGKDDRGKEGRWGVEVTDSDGCLDTILGPYTSEGEARDAARQEKKRQEGRR